VIVRGIGIDLVHLPRMRAIIDRWQDRFLQRVFTEQEIAYCQARHDPVPHFGARFAAKEAGLKALGTGLGMGVRWRELEVRRERGQAPVLMLSGRCRELALGQGADRMLLALSHDGDYALAQAMLVTPEGADVTAPAQTSAPIETDYPERARPPLRDLPTVPGAGRAGAGRTAQRRAGGGLPESPPGR
jgi:holo-[acyl-carrier protein] synthase